MSLFKNKYRIESVRLPNWDYSANGAYFITICTLDREHLFGRIENDEMILNAAGHFPYNFWTTIPQHFPHVLLDEFVVIPNHIHGILIIDKPINITENESTKPLRYKTLQSNIPTDELYSSKYKASISPKAGSISSAIRSYKNIVKRNAKKTNPDFEWQERFHDHIIRNHESFLKIRDYIKNNIRNWKDDKFFS